MSRFTLLLLAALLAATALQATYSRQVPGRVTPEKAQFDLVTVHLYNKGEYKRALDELERFKILYPHSQEMIRAQWWTGKLQAKLEKWDDAATTFLAVIGKYPGSQWAPESWYELGELYMEQAARRVLDKKGEEALPLMEKGCAAYTEYLKYLPDKLLVNRHDLVLYTLGVAWITRHETKTALVKDLAGELDQAERSFAALSRKFPASQWAVAGGVQQKVIWLYRNPIKDVAFEKQLKEQEAKLADKEKELKGREDALAQGKTDLAKAKEEFDAQLKIELEAIKVKQAEILKEQTELKAKISAATKPAAAPAAAPAATPAAK